MAKYKVMARRIAIYWVEFNVEADSFDSASQIAKSELDEIPPEAFEDVYDHTDEICSIEEVANED